MYRIWYKIEDWYREVKYAYQRVVRGYDDRATWDLGNYLADIAVPVIEKMLKDLKSYPSHPSEITMKGWEKILKEIKDGLSLEDGCSSNSEYEEKIFKKKREAAKLLGKYFWDLWT